jgi:hypothetical protein
MKVIMSVLDEGYYERTWWRLLWAYLKKIMSVVDDGTFIKYAHNNLYQVRS